MKLKELSIVVIKGNSLIAIYETLCRRFSSRPIREPLHNQSEPQSGIKSF